VRWICSTKEAQWKDLSSTESAFKSDANVATPLKLDPHVTFQTMEGFGGCFNELGWEALVGLPMEKRNEALKALFDITEANFNLGRVPIGANDFAGGWYSLDETPNDYEMKDFSIERDRHELIPFIKAAMKYQPKLAVWAVPWCPPSWMTTNGRYRHGHMKDDSQTLNAYALYLCKYLKAYTAEGVHVYAIHPQNEPNYSNNIYPQCAWTGGQINVFLRDCLMPHLKENNQKVEVWLGTIVSSRLADYTDPVLSDPVTNPGIAGVGYQYGAQRAFQETHDKYPQMKLSQTETECYHGDNKWEEGLKTFENIVDDTRHFASSYFFWNLVLDEGGLSRWNWRQNSLLTIDRWKDTIRYNPEFYSLKHFSAAVHQGARRIAISGGPFKNVVAFQNPDGHKVILFQNDSEQTVQAALETPRATVQLNVPAKSMNTVTLE
jgi:glucosylceramidase